MTAWFAGFLTGLGAGFLLTIPELAMVQVIAVATWIYRHWSAIGAALAAILALFTDGATHAEMVALWQALAAFFVGSAAVTYAGRFKASRGPGQGS